MLRKFALLIAVVVASVGFFLAGVYAPDVVREFLDPGSEVSAPQATDDESTGAEISSAEAPIEDATFEEEQELPLVEYDALQSTFMPPEGSQWGVQVRKYASESPATGLVADLRDIGVTTATFRVQDANDKTWFVVVAGPYANASEAEDRRIRLAAALSIEFRPSVVIYPAEPSDN